MKKKSTKRPVFQAATDETRLEKMRKIAEHKGVSMSRLFRMWVDANYNRLPPEAQK